MVSGGVMTDFLTSIRNAIAAIFGTVGFAIIDVITGITAAGFAAVCAGFLSLTMAVCHVLKMRSELKATELKNKSIELENEARKAEIDARLAAGLPLNRKGDKK